MISPTIAVSRRQAVELLTPSQGCIVSKRIARASCFLRCAAPARKRHDQHDDRPAAQEISGAASQAQAFGEGAHADVMKIGAGEGAPITCASRDSDETGISRPENWIAGSVVRIADAKIAAICVRDEGRDQQAERGGRGRHTAGAERQRSAAAFDRHPEQEQRQRAMQQEVHERDPTYGSCLPSRNSSPRERRDVEVGDRAQLLLAHDARAPSSSRGS